MIAVWTQEDKVHVYVYVLIRRATIKSWRISPRGDFEQMEES